MQLAEKTEEISEDVEFRLGRFYNKRNGKKGRQFLKKSMATWQSTENGKN